MKTKLMLATFVVMLLLSTLSCKKATINQPDVVAPQPNTNNSLAINKNGQLTQKGSTVLYQASSADLSAFAAAFNSSVAGGITGTGRPPACGVLTNASSMLERIDLVGGNLCNNNMLLDVTYEWMVFEGPLAIDPSPSTFTFTVHSQQTGATVYTGTVIGTPTQSTLTCDPTINACGHVFTYHVKITNMLQSDFLATTNTTNTVFGTGPGGCNTTTAISQSVSRVIPNSFYLNNPARVFVVGDFFGQVYIYNDYTNCQNLIYASPTGGLFKYKQVGTNTWSQLSLSPTGGALSGLSSNTPYDWECTLDYLFGSSQLATGQVTPQ
jgi:hypothetical protein